MKSEILKLLSPSLTVENAMKAAELIQISHHDRKAIELLQSFEAIKQKPLTKEMFVPNDKPKDFDKAERTGEIDEYEDSLSKVLFKGFLPNVFTEPEENHLYYSTGSACISWSSEEQNLRLPSGRITELGSITTIRDLLYHIEKYNETATQPITLEWTPNILNFLNIQV